MTRFHLFQGNSPKAQLFPKKKSWYKVLQEGLRGKRETEAHIEEEKS